MSTPVAPAESEPSRPDVFSLADPEALRAGLRAARIALGTKHLVVIPTDTHYAVAADAFSPVALAALARFKSWDNPPAPQVLLPNADALHALGAEVPEAISLLTQRFWPGPLTVVVQAGSSLRWNLGDSVEAVGLSLIGHRVIRELLLETGPLVISAAHPAGQAVESLEALIAGGHPDLAVVLVDEELPWDFSAPGSSVVEVVGDAHERGVTGDTADRSTSLRLLREGAVSGDELRSAAGDDVAWV